MSIAIVDDPHGGTGPHCPFELWASSSTGGDEVPVLARQGVEGYELTNSYADGIRGVRDVDREEAEIDESPACACCSSSVCEWQHRSPQEWALAHAETDAQRLNILREAPLSIISEEIERAFARAAQLYTEGKDTTTIDAYADAVVNIFNERTNEPHG